MNVALLGFAQAGKRSLFSLLTGRDLKVPAREGRLLQGVAPVRDPRVDEIARIAEPERVVYADTELVVCPDVAVDSTNREWLEAARQCDILCMVIRDFPAPEVYHPLGDVSAARDRMNLRAELILADLDLVETRLDRIRREKRGGVTHAQKMEEAVLERCRETLEQERMLSELDFDDPSSDVLRGLGLLTVKPIVWTCNIDESQLADASPDPETFIVSCLIEKEIGDIEDPEERRQFLAESGLSATGADRLNAAVYSAMGLLSFYTMGPLEVRAWSVRRGATAPEAAGKVHSDMQRGFIRAEVIAYDDLIQAGSEAEARTRGKMQLRGKDYVMQDGDICLFLFNV